MKTRDTQKARVYRAERILQDHKSSMKPMTITECQKFVNRVLARQLIIKSYGKRYIAVERGKGGGRASGTYYSGRVITLGVWARQPAVILHEIAHHLAGLDAEHGPHYAAVMLKLVRAVLGKEAHEKLLGSYAYHRVRVEGKGGKVAKARCPKSRKAWIEEQVKLDKHRKDLHKNILSEENEKVA
jgi:putative metallohydrolase (TIGR04338 family)